METGKAAAVLACAVGALALLPAAAGAHTVEMCWRDVDGVTTFYAGSYHSPSEGPSPVGDIIVDGFSYPFSGWVYTLPPDITGCVACDPGYPSVVHWQTFTSGFEPASHTISFDTSTAVQSPWCAFPPVTFGGGDCADADFDGICNGDDACPLDFDNDGDDDGVCGDLDNCPNVYNPSQDPQACVGEVCGNGEPEGSEECDDGNIAGGDGCSALCTIESGSTCGNSAVESGEECDDGNTAGDDGCSPGCDDEYCGDSVDNNGTEECDDGNSADSDGCLSDCTLAACGDGYVYTGTEECDDTNSVDGDGCSSACVTEYCGDGVVNNDGNEDCDDGNGSNHDGCLNDCTVASCGDGHLRYELEECDDDDLDAGDGCDDECEVEQCWSCSISPGSTTTLIVTGEESNDGPSVCEHDDGVSCDDGDECTLADVCSAGACGGEDVLIPAACDWAIVAGNPTKAVRARTRGQAVVTGGMCGGVAYVGEEAIVSGDAVGTLATGTKAMRIGREAEIAGDAVTGGGGILGKPAATALPGLEVNSVAPGTTVPKTETTVYDTTGSHASVADCEDAQDDIATSAALIANLPSGGDLGNVLVGAGQTRTLDADVVGGVNVIDIDKLFVGIDSTLEIDGGGNAATVWILRVHRKLDMALRSQILLTGSQDASKVVIVGDALCRFGENVIGAGTVMCEGGKLLMEERATWDGALLSGRYVQMRTGGTLNHVPMTVGQ